MVKLEKELLLFDWRTYYNTHKIAIVRDLEIDVKNRDVAWYHWKNFGKKNKLQYFKVDKALIASFVKSSGSSSDSEYSEFDWKQYVKNYSDLGNIDSKKKAWNHWNKYGKKEGRNWVAKDDVENDPEYQSFDWLTYLANYPDLNHFKNKFDAWKHWTFHGKIEGRLCKKLDSVSTLDKNKIMDIISEIPHDNWNTYEEEIYKDFCDFDWQGYVENYEDLRDINNKLDAWEHWFFQGRLEGRIAVNFNGIDDQYLKTIKIEEKCFPENKLIIKENLSMKTWVDHIYVTNFEFVPQPIVTDTPSDDYIKLCDLKKNSAGSIKNSMKRHKNIMKTSIFLKNLYKNKVDKFMKLFDISDVNLIMNDPNIEFRYFCLKYIDFMRNCFILPELELFQTCEAVFIEFREFDHVEFIIRNAIMRLGPAWSYTVVCGNVNYNFMITLCNNICKNIKVIKTTFSNVTINEYSDFLKTAEFWNLLIGEKILIYQEDSFIFNSNIDEFMDYDYIGAPWVERILPICVGNGGLSFRTRQIMLDVILAVGKEGTFSEEIISEDVFFSKHMQRLNIGRLADEETASKFSSELINKKDSFGGHQFWRSDLGWKKRVYDSINDFIVSENPNNFSNDVTKNEIFL